MFFYEIGLLTQHFCFVKIVMTVKRDDSALSMRKIFQKWLFIFVAVAFTLTFCLSFYLQTQQAEENAEKQIHLKLYDVIEQINQNELNLARIVHASQSETLVRVRSLAMMIKLDPSILKEKKRLQATSNTLEAEQVRISDEKGIVIAGVPESLVGQDMNADTETQPFMDAINNPNFELVQLPKTGKNQADQVQCAAVARKDAKGIVQIAYKARRLTEGLEIADIKNLAVGFRIGNNGRIIVAEGNVIVSSDDKSILGKNLDSIGIPLSELKGNQGTFWTSIIDTKTYCVYEKFERFFILGTLPASEIFENRDRNATTLVLLNFLLFGAVFILVTEMIKRIVIDGIESVNTSLKRITEGDLEEKVEVLTNQEFVALSDGINQTVQALRKAISEAATRIDNELEFARAIQLSAMPNIFPPYPTRNEFDLYATMFTAKNVGGDFYDFFLVDDNHLAIVIADVSGKGIPASLFMMTSKTVIKNFAESGISPGEIFTRTNAYLCENNDTCMFVTAFLGILEINTGRFTTVCAGHNPPLIMRAMGEIEWLRSEGGFVLAGIPGVVYSQSEWQLKTGDKIFLYTDGVTEAFNPEAAMFGEKRLKECVSSTFARNANLYTLLSYIRGEVEIFAGSAEQSDDITMLVLEYKL